MLELEHSEQNPRRKRLIGIARKISCSIPSFLAPNLDHNFPLCFLLSIKPLLIKPSTIQAIQAHARLCLILWRATITSKFIWSGFGHLIIDVLEAMCADKPEAQFSILLLWE